MIQFITDFYNRSDGLCEVMSFETGDSAKIECELAKVANRTLEDIQLMDNVTIENVTLHCSKSEFGCCPDWTTRAEGKNNSGCPIFVLGT